MSFEGMKGMGTLSGESIKRALIIGYIKRLKNLEGTAYPDGIISLSTAVRLLGITDKPDEEVERILNEAKTKTESGKIDHKEEG